MKRNIALLLSVLVFGFGLAQNKFEKTMNSRKLGASYKSVKEKDKDEYYQQYYWLVQMEKLKAQPHLKDIKPKILYQFVKEINPVIPTKTLEQKDKDLRQTAVHALNEFFSRKKWEDPLLPYNLETYVDPSASTYYTIVNPEKIQTLIPKQVYSFTSLNKQTRDEKVYYLWVHENDFEFINWVPSEKDATFYSNMNIYVPGYKISSFTPKMRVGDKKDPKDRELYYIMPFQEGQNNIEYRTKDFKNYEFIRYTKSGGPWTDIDRRER